jgi:ABC-type transport system involved in cytochrome c biogenesis permease subunit
MIAMTFRQLFLPALLLTSGLTASAADREPLLANFPILEKESIALLRTLPIQEEGRMKPLETFARYKLLGYSGYTSAKITFEGTDYRLEAIEWFALSIFHPDAVKDIPVFLVDDSRTLSRIGIKTEKPRDRHSFATLEPASDRILDFLRENREKMESFTADDKRLWDLCMKFRDFQLLSHHFDFSKNGVNLEGLDLKEPLVLPGDTMPLPAATMLERLVKLRETGGLATELPQTARAGLEKALGILNTDGLAATTLSVLPSSDTIHPNWYTPGEIILRTFEADNPPPAYSIAWLAEWGNLYQSYIKKDGSFLTALTNFHTKVSDAAMKGHGEGQRPPNLALESFYHQVGFFNWSGVIFTILFLVIAVTWFSPQAKWARLTCGISSWLLLVPFFLIITGITLRLMILNASPVTTLYETIPFITAFCVLMCLVMEWRLRNGIGASIAALSGFLGMWLTYLYETQLDAGVDTFQNLQAVLRSNFWLRTHVVTITIGYAGGAVAALISLIYILGRVTTLIPRQSSYAKDLTRMGYGAIAFCLLFSIVGTILGGIWANYSWGRFWGWDPKENGALMICLWSILIIHARLGGYLGQAGFHVLSVALGGIISFSWFGVNQLSIGLHAYGFNEKLDIVMKVLYYSTFGSAAIGSIFWFLDFRKSANKPETSAAGSARPSS